MPRVNPLALIPLGLMLALGVVSVYGLFRDNPEELPTVFIDKPIPSWPPETLEGYAAVDADALAGPGFKLVNFWASWCPPCRAEHPNLMSLQAEGWAIYGVNKEDKAPNARAFLGELGNPYAGIAVDPDGRDSLDWGVYGLPETFLIDGKGRIRHRFPGAVTKRVWRERFLPIIRSIEAEDAVQ